ncbi:SubName: Full=Uncharacterized protein {ECO:0000313/EMBL:CCA70896.1} [Serendipita indica DSM 11827]|uniref:F-box domain-containing protein n=1 Tax=Serendipita indica (strain DSM 11827) TaxID=1109443 RepID=G4THU7_SERID|nr:SubName: Full=Uncharacterized protein {ECO:0000313/EMBL:CCA70896.1} [Serendipita indica DSM 11827]CCA70896.1 hypothetical protein PIIN_04832 [Serendipita indica DSM 11827]
MSWSVLPVEVTLEIIEYLCPEINVGQIGKAAAWTKLWQTNNTDMEAEQNSNEGGGSEGVLSGSTQALSTNPWSALQSLALTNKYFYKLCIPFAHRDFVFTSNDWTPITDELVSKWVKHGGNVRNVRILLDPGFTLLFRYWEFLATTLATFTNVTSLALYYRSCHSLPRKVAEECVNILKTGKVLEFGIYSTVILEYKLGNLTWDRRMAWMAYDIIQQFSNNAAAANKLRVLDLVLETLPTEIYNLVRTQFPNLRALTIRRALRYQTLGRIWDANQLPYWKHRDNLTCLRLIDCSNAYAFHIPHLVRHFTSLRELMVSTCGASDDDTVGVQRSGGWSTESDALRNTHAPLEVFHIEHMTDWEIYALGVIPTKELSTSLITRGHLEAAFTRDPEIFPGLVLLRVEEYVNLEETTYREPTMANAPRTIKTLNAICTGRGIKVEKDAKWIRRKYIA